MIGYQELNIIIKDVTVVLRSAGISSNDIPLWAGIQGLDYSAYRTLIKYLKTATEEEIRNMNQLLRRKVDIFKSGDKESLRSLALEEAKEIIK